MRYRMVSLGKAKQWGLLLKVFMGLVPIVFVTFMLYLKITSLGLYRDAIREDAIVENLTCIAYFIACVLAFSIALRFLKIRRMFMGLSYLILALGFMFVSMEEISWGQRIFGFGTTRYMEQHNVQNEENVHNLSVIRPILGEMYILVGLIGSCTWLFVGRKTKSKYGDTIKYFVPDWYLSPYFIFIVLITGYLELLDKLPFKKPQPGDLFNWPDLEPAELLLSLGFLLFVVINKYRYFRESRRQSAKQL